MTPRADYFWRDHGAQLVLDPTLIRDAVRDGVKNGSWVYYDVQAQRAWTTKDPPPPITISLESVLYTLDEAKARGILGRELVWEDIDRVLKGDALTAVELRSKLEAAIGREPSKPEIAAVLARAAEGGRQARVVIVEGPAESGAKPLKPADIPNASFDGLTLVAPARGIELGLVIDDGGRPRPVEARGVAGVAFQQLFDRLSDVPGSKGVSRLTISASVEPGEGVRDISLLGKAIGMLPKLDISVDLEMPLEFAGLRHGVDVRLAGPASDYQRVEDAILSLARGASGVAGRLELSIYFAEAVTPGTPELERIRKVLADLQSGDLQGRGTRLCSDEATNEALSERERGNERGTAERGTSHAHERGTCNPAQTGVTVTPVKEDSGMTAIAFDVRGLPIAQGSARAFVVRGRAIIVTGANRLLSPLGAWRSAIATEARVAIGSTPPLTGPVRVDLRFRLPRPRSHYLPANGRRPDPTLRPDAPAYHAGKPDADKLTRAALDALTAVVFGDDAQVARLSVTKHYAAPSEGPGVAVAVQRLETTR